MDRIEPFNCNYVGDAPAWTSFNSRQWHWVTQPSRAEGRQKRDIFEQFHKNISFKTRICCCRLLDHIYEGTAVSSWAPRFLLMLHFSLCSGHTLWRRRGTRGTRMVKHFSHFFQLLVEKYFLENHNCSLSHQKKKSGVYWSQPAYAETLTRSFLRYHRQEY